jgi:hypothetical protein
VHGELWRGKLCRRWIVSAVNCAGDVLCRRWIVRGELCAVNCARWIVRGELCTVNCARWIAGKSCFRQTCIKLQQKHFSVQKYFSLFSYKIFDQWIYYTIKLILKPESCFWVMAYFQPGSLDLLNAWNPYLPPTPPVPSLKIFWIPIFLSWEHSTSNYKIFCDLRSLKFCLILDVGFPKVGIRKAINKVPAKAHKLSETLFCKEFCVLCSSQIVNTTL